MFAHLPSRCFVLLQTSVFCRSWTHRAGLAFWDSLDSAERLAETQPLLSGSVSGIGPGPAQSPTPGRRLIPRQQDSPFGVQRVSVLFLDLPLRPLLCCNGSWGTAGQRLLNGSAEPFSFSDLICSQGSSTNTCSGLLSTAGLASIWLCCTLLGSTVSPQRANLFHPASSSLNLFLYRHGVSVPCWVLSVWNSTILTLISRNDWCH